MTPLKANQSNIWMLLVAIITSFAIGTRSAGRGTDTAGYIALFENIRHQDVITGWPEPSFYILTKIVQMLSGSEQEMFLVYALITNFFIFRAISNYSSNKMISLIIFFCFGFFLMQFNVMRQAAAASAIVYAFSSLVDGKKKVFVLKIIVASLLHYTAILGLMMIFAINPRVTKAGILLFPLSFLAYLLEINYGFIGGLILNITSSQFLFAQYAGYGEEMLGRAGFGLKKLLQGMLIYLSALILMKNKSTPLPEVNLVLSGIGVIGWYLTIVFAATSVGSRLTLYFDIFILLLISNAVMALKRFEAACFGFMVFLFCVAILYSDITSGNYGVNF